MELTPETVLEARRELCKRSLAAFVKMAWHVIEPATPYVHGRHIDVMCAKLEAAARGDIRRLIINVPPGTAKSSIVGVFFPMWLWGPCGRPGERFVGVAHEQSLGIRDNLKCRRLATSPWFQKLWPIKIAGDQNEKLNFENSATGFRAVATPSNVTGRRGDCLLPGSMVQTNLGEIPIERLVNAAPSCKVLSYDAHSKRLVHRPIQAVARRQAADFYRLHFASGSVVECTGDHRVYTARGYVEARLLSTDDVFLRAVPKAGSPQRLRDEESGEARESSGLLQPKLQPDRGKPSGGEDRAELHNVRGEDTERPEALLAWMQSTGLEKTSRLEGRREGRAIVRNMQRPVLPCRSHGQSPLLLAGMQRPGALGSDGGAEQSGMEKRGEHGASFPAVEPSLPESPTGDYKTGRGRVRSVPVDGSPRGTPHRYGRGEQPVGQPRDALLTVPSPVPCGGTFQTQEDSLLMVERVREPTEVYDIQVEGTRCFFANRMLVHNCILVDDPISAENANSEAERSKVNTWFQESLPTRMNDPEKSVIILVMQRLHEMDPTGLILAKKWGWEHLNLPMRFEPDRASPDDWRTDEGELLFPERFPEHVVAELEATLGAYATAGQLQQRPAPREGGLFKRSWFKTVGAVPAGERRYVRAWDLAATKKATSNNPDWTAGVLMSRGADGMFLIEGCERLRGSPMEVTATVRGRAGTDPKGTIIRLPKDPGQAGVAQAETFVKDLAGFSVKVVAPSGDKATRAMPAASQAEVGNVAILVTGDPNRDAWIEPFLSEITMFPGAAHDDQVDAFADALNELALGGSTYSPYW